MAEPACKFLFSQKVQLEDNLEGKFSDWTAWRAKCLIGGRPPGWRALVSYALDPWLRAGYETTVSSPTPAYGRLGGLVTAK